MPALLSKGKCLYCSQEFAKTNLTRHLDKHLSSKAGAAKPGKSFLVKVEPNPKWGASPYFLHLWVDGNSTLQALDTFLRQIWLECCGHMSAFRNPKLRNNGRALWDIFKEDKFMAMGKTMDFQKLMEEGNGEIPKNRKAKDALHKDLKLEYEYDFGSTTALQLTVVSEYPIQSDKKIVLLSRNEPPEIRCETCGINSATQICSVCINHEESAFCPGCAKLHGKICPDFNDYAAMPVVNSPRMGVCAYEGGVIDTNRDGVFIKK